MTTPLVSIGCITFNHENYIREAIDGFLMQQTSFPIEILIHDDASTDKTQDIIREYANKYPELIIPILQTENQFSKGNKAYPVYIYPRAKGKYISLCEGDDYWIDPYKLHKQIEFLEKHKDFVFCAGKSLIRDGDAFRDGWSPKTETVTFKDIAHSNTILTNTLVFRNIFRDNDSSKFLHYLNEVVNGDIFTFLELLMKGNGYVLPDYVGVYRMHEGGIYSKKTVQEKYLHSLRTRNIIIEYLKDISVDHSYIEAVEYGYTLMLIDYLKCNSLTEEFVEIVPRHILSDAIDTLKGTSQPQQERSTSTQIVDKLVAERDAAIAVITAIKLSKSWRFTAPLRILGHIVNRGLAAIGRLGRFNKRRVL